MDSLPPEVLLKVLQNLPGNDVLCAQRVCKRFRDLIVNEKRRLPRPTMVISLGHPDTPYRQGPADFVLVALRFKSESVVLTLQNDGRLYIQNQTLPATSFLQSYFNENPPFSYNWMVDHGVSIHAGFFNWLCRRVQVTEHDWVTYLPLITQAMQNTGNQCKDLKIFSKGDELHPDRMGLFEDFRKVQDELQGKVDVEFAYSVVPDIWQSRHAKLWNRLGGIFDGRFYVLLNYQWMFAALTSISSAFTRGRATHCDINLFIDYSTPVFPCRRAISYAKKFHCNNVSDRELKKFKPFRGFYRLPKTFECNCWFLQAKLVMEVEQYGDRFALICPENEAYDP